MIAVIDVGTSNIRSVVNAFRRVGADPTVTTEADVLKRADAVVLPGVGAFANAMGNLEQSGLAGLLKRRCGPDGIPLLGICLGMQLLADRSEEHGMHDGLGLISGDVIRLAPAGSAYRVPNIGWYEADLAGTSRLVAGAGARSYYFVHSFHLVCTDPGDVAASISYDDRPIAAAVERGNVFGMQFHPERSQDAGLDLLERFVQLVDRRQRAA